MRRIFLSVVLLAATSMIFVSCKKGDVGPEGPAGPAGAAGPAGPQGPVGTANVIYSNWFKFQSTDWADTTVANFGLGKRANKMTTSMTQAVIDRGLVMAYAKYDEAGDLAGPYALPMIIPATATTQIIVNIVPAVGRIVYVNYTFPSAGGVGINPNFQFRYVIIPGGTAGRGETPTYNGYTIDELKAMPYETVAALFNIPAEGSN